MHQKYQRILLLLLVVSLFVIDLNNVQALEKENTINVHFEFVQAFAKDGKGNLPKDILELLPSDQKIVEGQQPILEEFGETFGYKFIGWNLYKEDDNNLTYQGVWQNTNKPNMTFKLYSNRTGDYSGFGDPWPYHNRFGYIGHNEYLLSGQWAYCVEPDKKVPKAGTSYSYSYTDHGDIARIIAMGNKNGMSHGAIQATLDNFFHGLGSGWVDTDENVDPNSEYYDDSNYDCSVQIFESSDPDAQSYASGYDYQIRNGALRVVVNNGDNSYDFLDYENNYTLENATFGVYSDLECTKLLTILTSNVDGLTPSYGLPAGDYFIKQLEPSMGFKKDANIYPAKVVLGNTTTVYCIELPYKEVFDITLYKQNYKDLNKTKYLDEAQYLISYYDTKADDISGLQPEKSWLFQLLLNEENKAELKLDEAHHIGEDDLVLDQEGVFYIPLGVVTLEEYKAPQTYKRDENIYLGKITYQNGDSSINFADSEFLSFEDNTLIHLEQELILDTQASFQENKLSNYPADGYAHIVDKVFYDNLDPNEEYILKAQLIKKQKPEEDSLKSKSVQATVDLDFQPLLECSYTFSPEQASGEYEVVFPKLDLDAYENQDFVIYEQLYSKQKEQIIATHCDIDALSQTINIEKLYNADFALYKVGDNNQSHKLDGAYFSISSKRTKRDGRVVEKDLGKYVTGGIYLENIVPFTVQVYSDENLENKVGDYESKYDDFFQVENVTIFSLAEGEYYTTIDQKNETLRKFTVSKGMILLEKQEEDSELTFKELKAPAGYYLDSRPFTLNVGHDYEASRVNNYRSNTAIILPITGVD